jgi:DNA gyrase/topoisomerase IV subunit A
LEIKKEENLENFIEEQYEEFIKDRFSERIPGFDGLIDVHRKLVYSAFTWESKLKGKRRVGVSSLGSQLKIVTDYGKGEENTYKVIKNICGYHAPLFIGEGDYPTRTEPEGAQARYIGVLFPKYIDALFPKLDNTHLVDRIWDEDEERWVEPYTYYPTIPLLLLYGQQQIGTGYSVHVLPRSVKALITTLKQFTKGNKLQSTNWRLPIHLYKYRGEINRVGAKKDRQWMLKGKYKWDGNTLVITEYRYNQNPYTYKDHLEKLKKEGWLYSYIDQSYRDTIHYEIKCLNKTRNLTDKQIRDLFLLDGTVTENICDLDIKEKVFRVYTDETAYIKNWYYKRLDIVKRRKQWLINMYNHEMELLKSQIYYMYQIINKKLDVTGMDTKKLMEYLEKERNIIQDIDPNTKEDRGYEYITKLRITALTVDNIARKNKKIKEMEDFIADVRKKTPEEMYYDDLDVLEKALKKEHLYV